MVIAPNSNNDDEARTQMIDSFVALTQKFFDEEDQFIVLEASEQIALLHEMASILEREERVFEETMNDPFEIDRESMFHPCDCVVEFFLFTQPYHHRFHDSKTVE